MKRYRLPSYVAKMAAKLSQLANIAKLPANVGVTVEQAHQRADKTLYNALVQLTVNKVYAVKNNIMPSLVPTPPVVTSFVAEKVFFSYSVAITGTNFTGATSVKVRGTSNATYKTASITSITPTKIVVSVNTSDIPAGVTVTTPNGTVTSLNNVQNTLPPSISNVILVGTGITVQGMNLQNITSVSVTAPDNSDFAVSSSSTLDYYNAQIGFTAVPPANSTLRIVTSTGTATCRINPYAAI